MPAPTEVDPCCRLVRRCDHPRRAPRPPHRLRFGFVHNANSTGPYPARELPMIQRRRSLTVALALLGMSALALFTQPPQASAVPHPSAALLGPGDNHTKYHAYVSMPRPPGFIGPMPAATAVVDSGGATLIGFEDAKKLGLLNPDGSPAVPPAGSGSIGGVGAGSIQVHNFDNVTIVIQTAGADGAPGAERSITLTVSVPKAPDEQTQLPAALRERMVRSLPTLLGPNVTGAVIGGGKIQFDDQPGPNPRRNLRGTSWALLPWVPTLNEVKFEVTDGEMIRTAACSIGGIGFDASVSTLPVTIVPLSLALQLGLQPAGVEVLRADMHDALFARSVLPTVAREALYEMIYGFTDITVQTTNGSYVNKDVLVMLHPDPNFADVIIGSNALIPEGRSAQIDMEANLLRIGFLE